MRIAILLLALTFMGCREGNRAAIDKSLDLKSDLASNSNSQMTGTGRLVAATNQFIRLQTEDVRVGDGYSFSLGSRYPTCFTGSFATNQSASFTELSTAVDRDSLGRILRDSDDNHFLRQFFMEKSNIRNLDDLENSPYRFALVGIELTIKEAIEPRTNPTLKDAPAQALRSQRIMDFAAECGPYFVRELTRKVDFYALIRVEKNVSDKILQEILYHVDQKPDGEPDEDLSAAMKSGHLQIFSAAQGVNTGDIGLELLPQSISKISQSIQEILKDENIAHQGAIVGANIVGWSESPEFNNLAALDDNLQTFNFLTNAEHMARVSKRHLQKRLMLDSLQGLRLDLDHLATDPGSESLTFQSRSYESADELSLRQILVILNDEVLHSLNDDFAAESNLIQSCSLELQGRSFLSKVYIDEDDAPACLELDRFGFWPATTRLLALYLPLHYRIEGQMEGEWSVFQVRDRGDGRASIRISNQATFHPGQLIELVDLDFYSGISEIATIRRQNSDQWITLDLKFDGDFRPGAFSRLRMGPQIAVE